MTKLWVNFESESDATVFDLTANEAYN